MVAPPTHSDRECVTSAHAHYGTDHSSRQNTHTKMANKETDNSLYPIAVLIDELRNDDVNVSLCERDVVSV